MCGLCEQMGGKSQIICVWVELGSALEDEGDDDLKSLTALVVSLESSFRFEFCDIVVIFRSLLFRLG